MYRACIATIDATRARFFTFERESDGQHVRESLREQPHLENAARRLHQHLGDHAAHVEQLDVTFAHAIADALAHEVNGSVQRLVVCATPHMLGDLRGAGIPKRSGLTVDEVPRDLVQLTGAELRDQLASYGLLPPRVSHPGGELASPLEQRLL